MNDTDATDAYENNRRNQYLFQTLGLNHDPFAFSVAEHELQVNSAAPPFLSYFVDLPADASGHSLLDHLKQPGHAVIWGGAGSGKTTLRYALEAHCRFMVNRILVVSQPLGKGGPEARATIPSLPAFLQAFAVDLFVQTLEHFESLPQPPDAELIHDLGRFWQRFIPNFKRTVTRQMEVGKLADAPTGISVWWRTWKRVVVKYTPWTETRRQFMEMALSVKVNKKTVIPSFQDITQASVLAHRLGYQQIYYLVDVADTSHLNIPQLLNQLQEMGEWETAVASQTALFFKLFLPERLRNTIQNSLNRLPPALISPSFSAIIRWKDSMLFKALLANRFRSAGSWIQGFDVLAKEEIATELTDKFIEIANSSPRALLQFISLLLNTHAAHAPDDPLITAEEWQETCAAWSYRPSYPASLMVHDNKTEGNKHDQWHTTTNSQYSYTDAV